MSTVLLAAGCAAPEAPRLTYFHPSYAISFRYPPRWQSELAERDGIRYLFFRSPPTRTRMAGAVSATVIAQPLGAEQSLDDFAAHYLEGVELASRAAPERPGAAGAIDAGFSAVDGSTRSRLLLLEEQRHVFGLHVQGQPARFGELLPEIEEMVASFSLERPSLYTRVADDRFGFALRIPSSWRSSRRFTRGDTLFLQYTSPAVAVDPQDQTVHASLTLSVEPIVDGGGLDAYYDAIRERFGDAYPVLSHQEWNGGYVDVMRAESAMTVSRVRRFYLADSGRGYSLSCEAREDVQHRVFGWCDMIASTLRVGEEARES